jgi:hypothetical protein
MNKKEVVMISIVAKGGVSLRVDKNTRWYVHPQTEVVNNLLAEASGGGEISTLNVINGPSDLPVWNVPQDKVDDLFKRHQNGRVDIKFDLYKKTGVMIELIVRVD